MTVRVLASSLRPRSLTRILTPGPATEQMRARIPVLWPRYLPGAGGVRRVVMEAIDPALIPVGWQSIQIHVPMRLATCEETDCPMFLRGWTEILPADGTRISRAGQVSGDEAALTFGLFGPLEIPPAVIEHPPGTPCPRVHKRPAGIPPLYTVDGRTVLWTQFEDAIGGGLHQAQRHLSEGVN